MVVIEMKSDDLEGELEDITQQFLTKVGAELQRQLNIEAPEDTGRLAQSIQLIRRDEGEVVVAIRAGYAAALQSGTRPFTPPVEPLKRWVRRKLNQPEEMAWAIQEKISEEGIDENPFVTRAIQNLRDKYG